MSSCPGAGGSATWLAAVALAAGIAGCDRLGGKVEPAGAAAAPRKLARAFPVAVETVSASALVYRIESLGQLEADEEVQVATEVEGVLGPLAFREGDRVDPGTVLVEVDPARYRLQVDRATAAVTRMGADLREKEASLARRNDLRAKEQSYVPEEEILRFEAEVAEGKAALAEAEADLGLARHDLARSRIRPPFAGEIERRLVSGGQWVARGTPIAMVVKRRPLRLRFALTEEESAKVAAGAVVSFRSPAFGAEEFKGVVFFVARTANARTRRIECLAQVPNEDERLKPGFFARVSIETASRADALLAPEAAVRATEAGFIAFVVDGERRARRRILETGLRTPDGRIEVRSGLAPGESLVVRGAGLLEDGATVTIEGLAPGGSARP